MADQGDSRFSVVAVISGNRTLCTATNTDLHFNPCFLPCFSPAIGDPCLAFLPPHMCLSTMICLFLLLLMRYNHTSSCCCWSAYLHKHPCIPSFCPTELDTDPHFTAASSLHFAPISEASPLPPRKLHPCSRSVLPAAASGMTWGSPLWTQKEPTIPCSQVSVYCIQSLPHCSHSGSILTTSIPHRPPTQTLDPIQTGASSKYPKNFWSSQPSSPTYLESYPCFSSTTLTQIHTSSSRPVLPQH